MVGREPALEGLGSLFRLDASHTVAASVAANAAVMLVAESSDCGFSDFGRPLALRSKP